MARPEVEREAEEESEDAQSGVSTDPARTPQNEDDGPHRVVAPDEEKVEEHEREKRREEETPEEGAEHIKNA